MDKIIQIIKVIKDWFQKQTAEEKRRMLLIGTGVFTFILTLSVIISIVSKSGGSSESEGVRMIINSPIPAGELFIPEEPDFIPGVILGRERQSSWTEEYASEHWQDPLKKGEEHWREKIETAIDELWERIP